MIYQSTFLHLLVQEGIASDSQYAKVIKDDIKPGDLCLRDLGYFSTENLIDIDKQGGCFFRFSVKCWGGKEIRPPLSYM